MNGAIYTAAENTENRMDLAQNAIWRADAQRRVTGEGYGYGCRTVGMLYMCRRLQDLAGIEA